MPLPSTSEWPTDDDSRVPPVTLHELMRQVKQHYAAERPAMLAELRHVMALPLDDSSWPVDRTPNVMARAARFGGRTETVQLDPWALQALLDVDAAAAEAKGRLAHARKRPPALRELRYVLFEPGASAAVVDEFWRAGFGQAAAKAREALPALPDKPPSFLACAQEVCAEPTAGSTAMLVYWRGQEGPGSEVMRLSISPDGGADAALSQSHDFDSMRIGELKSFIAANAPTPPPAGTLVERSDLVKAARAAAAAAARASSVRVRATLAGRASAALLGLSLAQLAADGLDLNALAAESIMLQQAAASVSAWLCTQALQRAAIVRNGRLDAPLMMWRRFGEQLEAAGEYKRAAETYGTLSDIAAARTESYGGVDKLIQGMDRGDWDAHDLFEWPMTAATDQGLALKRSGDIEGALAVYFQALEMYEERIAKLKAAGAPAGGFEVKLRQTLWMTAIAISLRKPRFVQFGSGQSDACIFLQSEIMHKLVAPPATRSDTFAIQFAPCQTVSDGVLLEPGMMIFETSRGLSGRKVKYVGDTGELTVERLPTSRAEARGGYWSKTWKDGDGFMMGGQRVGTVIAKQRKGCEGQVYSRPLSAKVEATKRSPARQRVFTVKGAAGKRSEENLDQFYSRDAVMEGLYSPRLLACDMCGKAGSFETLKKCSRCKVRSRIMPQRPLSPRPDRFYPSQSVAYCGVACQHAGWKNGHKHECKQLAAAAGV